MKYEITWGTELDRYNMPVRDVARKISDVEHLTAKLFEGYTLYRGVGGWFHPEHKCLVREGVITIVLYTTHGEEFRTRVNALADFIATTFNQHSVMISSVESFNVSRLG